MELTEKKGERERERDGRMRRGKGQGKSKWQWQGEHARKEEEEDKRKVYCYGAISYVGVIWFLFHVHQLLPIRFTQQNETSVAFANLRRNICKKRIGNRTSHALVMVIGSACLLIS